MDLKSPNRQFAIGIALILTMVLIGVQGYHLAGWTLLESFYMVIITIFGVGYGEVHEMGPELRVFTLLLIILGCTSLIYTTGAFINWLTEGQLQQLMGKRKVENEIKKLDRHTVVCGYGRVGRILAEDLKAAGRPFVVVEKNAQQIEQLHKSGYLYLIGDATEEEVLKRAKIDSAIALATVIPNDAINLFIVLTCRSMKADLLIVSRANESSSEAKLYQAGANKIVMPESIGADRIAHMIIRPNAQEVLEKDLHDNAFIESLHDIGLEMNEILIFEGSPFVGKTLADLETKSKSAFMVVAVRKQSGESIVKPALDVILEEQDTLIVMSHQGFIPVLVTENTKRTVHYRGAKA